MRHRIGCRVALLVLGISLLLASAASAATISGVVNLSDTPGTGDAGVQVALTQFDPQQELFNTPTMGQWGLVLTGLLLAFIGTWLMIRRRSLGGWGTGVGIVLMLFAVIPNMVGTARSVDPVVVTSGAGGTYSFTGVAVGQWGVSAYKELYLLSSSSLAGGIVPVAVNVVTAGDNININLTMTPNASCPAAKGLGAPESVPGDYWASIRSSREWNELAPELGKAGTQVHEGNATLVRGIGSEFSSVIIPITSTSIQSNQSRNFVSHFSGTGEYLGSYVIDLVSPVGVFDEGSAVPDVIRLTTPDGRLIAEARYRNGQLISQVEGPGMPRIENCLGFARCLVTKWAGIPGWIRRICKGACVSCFTTPAGVPCSVCAACVIVYVGNCWCLNAPCPP